MKHFCTFSEAIREGAKLRPQGRRFYFPQWGERSCAFGAGMEAVFGNQHESPNEIELLYPYLSKISLPSKNPVCPDCKEVQSGCLMTVIFHLNDDHLWTREQIADWLESEEEKLGFITLTETESQTESKVLSESKDLQLAMV